MSRDHKHLPGPDKCHFSYAYHLGNCQWLVILICLTIMYQFHICFPIVVGHLLWVLEKIHRVTVVQHCNEYMVVTLFQSSKSTQNFSTIPVLNVVFVYHTKHQYHTIIILKKKNNCRFQLDICKLSRLDKKRYVTIKIKLKKDNFDHLRRKQSIWRWNEMNSFKVNSNHLWNPYLK